MEVPAKAYFHEGCLYYINDFEFDDGGGKEKRNKYVLVLAKDDKSIVFCLTTTTDVSSLPSEYKLLGCRFHKINKRFQFYYFPPTIEIGSEKFKFESETIISFQTNIRRKAFNDLDRYVGKDGCEFKTQLSKDELKPILGCILSSYHCPIGCESLLNNRLLN
jgi:hypothetical protein